MTVKQLITELQKHNPEKEVYIQQGEEYEYMTVYTVREKAIFDVHEDNEINIVVIEYQ